MQLEEWISRLETIFMVAGVLEEKKVNIGVYYLTAEAKILWNTVKGRLVAPEFI